MRPDREESVHVEYKNIEYGLGRFLNFLIILIFSVLKLSVHQFNKMDKYRWDSKVGKYDVKSIMQYDGYAFSRNGDPTIVLLNDFENMRRGDPVFSANNENIFSEADIAQLNSLYPHSKKGYVNFYGHFSIFLNS